MSAASFNITGMDVVIKKLLTLKAELQGAVGNALYAEMLVEAEEVKARTPVDTGALQESVTVIGPVFTARTVTVSIIAGGPTAPYAVFVHEDLDAFHKTGQAKFLESVILESRPYLSARVMGRLQEEGTLAALLS
jgi:hypothetical protein